MADDQLIKVAGDSWYSGYNAGLEAAAKVCEKVADLPALNSYFDARAEGARILAGRIRALKDAG